MERFEYTALTTNEILKESVAAERQSGQRRLFVGMRKLNEMVLDEVFIAAVHTNPRWFAHQKEFKNIGASVDGFMYFYTMTK